MFKKPFLTNAIVSLIIVYHWLFLCIQCSFSSFKIDMMELQMTTIHRQDTNIEKKIYLCELVKVGEGGGGWGQLPLRGNGKPDFEIICGWKQAFFSTAFAHFFLFFFISPWRPNFAILAPAHQALPKCPTGQSATDAG